MPIAEKLAFSAFPWGRHALLTADEMRRAEQAAFKTEASFNFMKRAGEAVAAQIMQRWQPGHAVVLCGPGNNGGDGLIAAQALHQAGWTVTVGGMKPADQLSGDAAQAAKNWWGRVSPLEGISFDGANVIVDALFGIGLTRPIEGAAAEIIERMNKSQVPVVAVDVPSGLDADTGAVLGVAPQAALTVTFFRKKPAHCLMPGLKLCGETVVADIGIRSEVLDSIKPLSAWDDSSLWLDLYPFPQPEGHKYDRGHALVIGGAVMTGATRLGARAAQRVGAGLVTLAAPEEAVSIYATALESVIVRDISGLKDLLDDPKRNALLIGPGLGIGEAQKDMVLTALSSGKPCVLDADALTNFATQPEALFYKLNMHCVLTPHEGEFARIFGGRIDPQMDKLSRTRMAAKIAGCIVLLKGSDTVIADPDGRAVINCNAPPWLAVAGAGDVLAGMILGLITQGMHVFPATAAAAWMHGLIAARFGPGLIAEDLIEGVPSALRGLSDTLKGV